MTLHIVPSSCGVQAFRKMACALILLLATLLLSGVAHASEPPIDLWEQRPFAIEGHVGLGTPLGALGVALDVTPIKWVSLNAGVGAGLGDGKQASLTRQIAFGARGRYSFGRTALALGGGYSFGPYVKGDTVFDAAWWLTWDRADWWNTDFSVEHRWESGVQFRAYVGLAMLLDPYNNTCSGDIPRSSCDAHSKTSLPYLGVAVGYSLPPL